MKKFSVFLFQFFFFKSSQRFFVYFLINFFPLHIKKIQVQTPLLFFYEQLVIPVTDKINS